MHDGERAERIENLLEVQDVRVAGLLQVPPRALTIEDAARAIEQDLLALVRHRLVPQVGELDELAATVHESPADLHRIAAAAVGRDDSHFVTKPVLETAAQTGRVRAVGRLKPARQDLDVHGSTHPSRRSSTPSRRSSVSASASRKSRSPCDSSAPVLALVHTTAFTSPGIRRFFSAACHAFFERGGALSS